MASGRGKRQQVLSQLPPSTLTMPPFNLPFPIVLASASPRRKELLSELISQFEVLPAEIEENLPEFGDPKSLAKKLARKKAEMVAMLRTDALVIAGDTVVAVPNDAARDWIILAKPKNKAGAAAMLSLLSGRSHVVVTGVCVKWPQGMLSFAESTTVVFRRLGEEEIRAYAETGEPLDKAGSYAIQRGAKGFVESIEGSVSNVVGLPLERLKEALNSIGKRSRE